MDTSLVAAHSSDARNSNPVVGRPLYLMQCATWEQWQASFILGHDKYLAVDLLDTQSKVTNVSLATLRTKCLAWGTENSLTWGMRLGHVFIVESAALSAVTCGLLLAYIAWNGLRNKFKPPAVGEKRTYFLRTPLDYYLLSLFICDIILALGCLMHIRWIMLGEVEQGGSFCIAQAVLKQVGDVGVALSSLAIAVHTFFVLFFRWRAPQGKILPLMVLTLIWGILILITVLPSVRNKSELHHFRPAAYWCSIGDRDQRTWLLFAFLWFTAGINLLLYVPLFFCLRGNIVVNNQHVTKPGEKSRFKIEFKRVESKYAWAQDSAKRHEATAVAKQMLIFPVIYIVLIVPLSAVRLYQFKHEGEKGGHTPQAANALLPYPWTAFAGVVFASSGFVNVLLYMVTRPGLFPSFKKFKARARGGDDSPNNASVHEAKDAGGGTPSESVSMSSSGQHHRRQPHVSPAPLSDAGIVPVPMLTADDDDDDYPPVSKYPGKDNHTSGDSEGSIGKFPPSTNYDIQQGFAYTSRC